MTANRRPPKGLGPSARAFWRSISATYHLERWAYDLLDVAARALDMHDRASGVLSAEGMSYADGKGVVRARPEVAIVRDSRIGFLRACRELRLEADDPSARSHDESGGTR